MNRLFCLIFSALFLMACSRTVWSQSAEPAFVQIDPKLGKVVYHRVLQHETLYGIAKIYGVRENDLHRLNPKLKKHRKKLPPVIKIPIRADQVLARLPLLKSKRDFIPIYYVAKKKDNPFRISRVLFDMPTNLLVKRNNIKQNRIKEGQTLHIGWLKKEREPLVVRVGRETESKAEEIKTSEQRMFELQLEEHQVIQTNQVAYWTDNQSSRGLFVMHRVAPTKSIIEIVNPMYDKVAYAKVIGKLPDHLYSKEIDMVVSPALAKELGVVDSKFFVQVRYQADHSMSGR